MTSIWETNRTFQRSKSTPQEECECVHGDTEFLEPYRVEITNAGINKHVDLAFLLLVVTHTMEGIGGR